MAVVVLAVGIAAIAPEIHLRQYNARERRTGTMEVAQLGQYGVPRRAAPLDYEHGLLDEPRHVENFRGHGGRRRIENDHVVMP